MPLLWTFFFLSFSELQVQQQRLQEGSTVSGFCGPETEKHTNLDCISIPQQNILDLHNNGINWSLLQNHHPPLVLSENIYSAFNLVSRCTTQCNNERFVKICMFLHSQGSTVKCRGSTMLYFATTVHCEQKGVLNDVHFSFYNFLWLSGESWRNIYLVVVLSVQASISSPWSTHGMALCGLFPIQKRISRWFPLSLTAARGKIQT